MRFPALFGVPLVTLVLASLAPAQYGDISDVKILKPEDKLDVKSTPAPKGAVVLFDGKKLDGWVQRRDGKTPTAFKLVDGVMQVHGGDSHTKETFTGPFKLHVEFRVP